MEIIRYHNEATDFLTSKKTSQYRFLNVLNTLKFILNVVYLQYFKKYMWERYIDIHTHTHIYKYLLGEWVGFFEREKEVCYTSWLNMSRTMSHIWTCMALHSDWFQRSLDWNFNTFGSIFLSWTEVPVYWFHFSCDLCSYCMDWILLLGRSCFF